MKMTWTTATTRVGVAICALVAIGGATWGAGPRGTAAAPSGAPLASSASGLKFALVFNRNLPDKSVESGKVSYVWGADNVGTAVDSSAVGVHHTYYILLGSDNSWNPHISYFLDNHPDWILYKNDRVTPAYETTDDASRGGRPPLDITSPAVRQYLLNTYLIPAYQGGFQGVAFDNAYSVNFKGRAGVYSTAGSLSSGVSAGSTAVTVSSSVSAGTSIAFGNSSDMEYRNVTSVSGSGPYTLNVNAPLSHGHAAGEWLGTWTQQYSGSAYDDAYRTATVNAFHALTQSIRSVCPGWTISINHSIESAMDDPSSWYDLTSDADVVLDEWGFTYLGYGNGYLTSSSAYGSSNPWLDEAQYVQKLTSEGKGVVLGSQAPSSVVPDPSAPPPGFTQWILANYLLVKGTETYQSLVDAPYGGPIYWQPQYDTNVGSAVGLMYAASGVYMRQFTNALAIVNPSSAQSATITLPRGRYFDTSGHRIFSLTLDAHSGVVLTGGLAQGR